MQSSLLTLRLTEFASNHSGGRDSKNIVIRQAMPKCHQYAAGGNYFSLRLCSVLSTLTLGGTAGILVSRMIKEDATATISWETLRKKA